MAEIAPIPGLNAKSTPVVTKYVQAPHSDPLVQRTIKNYIRSTSGRDSILKSTQYLIRLILYLKHKPHLPPSRFLSLLFTLVAFLSALRRLLSLSSLLNSLRSNTFRSLFKTGHLPGAPHSKTRKDSSSKLVELSRQLLDLISTLSDNLYLAAKVGILGGISREKIRSIDQLSDLSSLLCALLGLVQLSKKRTKLFELGKERREKVIRLERELEDLEFSFDDGEVRDLERVEQEKKLRETVRNERFKLRNVRKELGGLRWDRLKLSLEILFALYDALDLQLARDGAKSVAGVLASLIE
ncbi:hypothetical protein JCM5353_000982 [Sporobolomyces roseus]